MRRSVAPPPFVLSSRRAIDEGWRVRGMQQFEALHPQLIEGDRHEGKTRGRQAPVETEGNPRFEDRADEVCR